MPGVPDPSHRAGSYIVMLSDAPYNAKLASVSFGGGTLSFDCYGAPSSAGTLGIAVGSYTSTVTLDAGTGKATAK